MDRIKSSRWILLSTITVIGFGLDIFTKHLAATRLTLHKPVSLIGDYLQFMLTYNKGGLFGINPRQWFPNFPVNGFFYVFSVIAIVLLFFYFKNMTEENKLGLWGIYLILPGALGNLFDRIIHPQLGVVDFIRMGIPNVYYWPIYNFADIYITFGVIFLLIEFVKEEKRRKAADSENLDQPPTQL